MLVGDGVVKNLLLAAALTALFAGSANGADLATPYKAPIVSIYNWTGCYVGGSAGALMADKEWFDATPGSPTFGVSYGTHSPSNVLLSLQAGCDFQAGNWVIGVQGEYGWSDARDSNRNSLIGGFADRTEIKALGTATARLGYAWDRVLGYLKGGATWEHDNYEIYLVGTDLVTATASETRGGWTAGFGAEVAFLPPVSGFVEANYYDFGRKQNSFTPTGGGATFPIEISDRKVVVRGGINWRFSAGPVAAKY
jgi:outer membrane immunogenic protein